MDLQAATQHLRLLADPTRVRLLLLLDREELSVAELAAITQLAQPRVSTHLARLKEAGLVSDRRDGVFVYYRIARNASDPALDALWRLLRGSTQDPLVQQDMDRVQQVLSHRSGEGTWADSVAGDMERHYSPGRTWEATARALARLLKLGDVLDEMFAASPGVPSPPSAVDEPRWYDAKLGTGDWWVDRLAAARWLGPPGTPSPLVEKLAHPVVGILANQSFVERGLVLVPHQVEELARIVAAHALVQGNRILLHVHQQEKDRQKHLRLLRQVPRDDGIDAQRLPLRADHLKPEHPLAQRRAVEQGRQDGHAGLLGDTNHPATRSLSQAENLHRANVRSGLDDGLELVFLGEVNEIGGIVTNHRHVRRDDDDVELVGGVELAGLGDVFVNDAFGTAHRAQASTYGVGEHAPVACAGPLLAAELDALAKALDAPARPFVAIVGGSKVSTKLTVLDVLADKVDTLIVGGGIANTFIAAEGHGVGKSLYEADMLDTARKLAADTQDRAEIPVPDDVVCGSEFSADAAATTRSVDAVADDEMILDIGPQTARRFAAILENAGTIIWNGPVGVFEFDQFGEGTRILAEAIAASPAFSVAGGGDTLAAIDKYGVRDGISYISTGGGAFLEFVEGKKLPAVAMLERRAAS